MAFDVPALAGDLESLIAGARNRDLADIGVLADWLQERADGATLRAVLCRLVGAIPGPWGQMKVNELLVGARWWSRRITHAIEDAMTLPRESVTVAHLLTLTANDLLMMRNIGSFSLDTVRVLLAQQGLFLRGEGPGAATPGV